jgi:hypothetical protein
MRLSTMSVLAAWVCLMTAACASVPGDGSLVVLDSPGFG